MFDKFLPGLMPYRIHKNDEEKKDYIFFTSPSREKGVGMAFPDIENDKVYIPQRIDLTYEYYKNICKAFLKINIIKYKLHTIPNQKFESFFIILDKNNKIDYRQLSDYVDVLCADKNISSKKSHKILVNITLLMDSINEYAKKFESIKNTWMIAPTRNGKIARMYHDADAVKEVPLFGRRLRQVKNTKEKWEKDLENNKKDIDLVMSEIVTIHEALQKAKASIDILLNKSDFPKGEGEKIKESLEAVCGYTAGWSFDFMTRTVPNCPLWNIDKEKKNESETKKSFQS